MNIVTIGIDVDGVLTDLYTFQKENAIPFFMNKYNLEVKDPEAYDIKDIFACSDAQREQFWIRYIWKYCLRSKMTPHAAATVRELRKRGHKIYIITGRVHTTEKGITGKLFRWMLTNWLAKNEFEYDKIFYVSEKRSAIEKYNICISEKVDVLIDDSAENLLALKDKIKIICFDAAWNECFDDFDSCRICRFEELLKII